MGDREVWMRREGEEFRRSIGSSLGGVVKFEIMNENSFLPKPLF